MKVRTVLGSMIALAFAAGCRTAADRTVALQIAEVVTPTELAAGAALHLTVTVYSGGCTSFGSVKVDRTDAEVTLHATGTDTGGAGVACPDILYTNTVPIDVAPPFTDPLAIVAVQPDGTTLTKTVRIRSSPAQSRNEP